MTVFRRIAFGEPKPGGQQFAGLLAKGLAESVTYCNRVGPLLHDRVTDLPYSFPEIGLDLIHPVPMKFVSAAPDPSDSGTFSYHHIELYQQGALVAQLDPMHIECVNLCAAIYDDTNAKWDARFDTSGVSWGVKAEASRSYVVFRGSKVLIDWLNDVTAIDPDEMATDDAFGPMWGGFMIGVSDAWSAIKPLISQAKEVVFTGHSLGAAHADIAAAYAICDASKTVPPALEKATT